MVNWLPGKRVLVTRPKQRANELLQRIQAQGGEAVNLPLMVIEPLLETAQQRGTILNLDNFDYVIVTSVNAAAQMQQLVDKYWPQVPLHPRWLAVGRASAETLQQQLLELNVSYPKENYSSEALLDMSALAAPDQAKILIAKGIGGRELLAQELQRRGAVVEELPLYRRLLAVYSADYLQQELQESQIDAMIVTSVEMLDNLLQVAAPYITDIHNIPLVTASNRQTTAARQRGFQRIFEAQSAEDESILQALNVIG